MKECVISVKIIRGKPDEYRTLIDTRATFNEGNISCKIEGEVVEEYLRYQQLFAVRMILVHLGSIELLSCSGCIEIMSSKGYPRMSGKLFTWTVGSFNILDELIDDIETLLSRFAKNYPHMSLEIRMTQTPIPKGKPVISRKPPLP